VRACLRKPEEDTGSPGTRVIGGCESCDVGTGNKTRGPLRAHTHTHTHSHTHTHTLTHTHTHSHTQTHTHRHTNTHTQTHRHTHTYTQTHTHITHTHTHTHTHTQTSGPDMVAHVFNPSTQEAEAGVYLWVQGQPGLQREFQDIQGYLERTFLKKNFFFID